MKGRRFPLALLGRLVTMPYYPLSGEMLGSIVRLQLNRIKKRVEARYRIRRRRGQAGGVALHRERVGRAMIDAILTNTMLPDISREFLKRMMDGQPVERVSVGVGGGGFVHGFGN